MSLRGRLLIVIGVVLGVYVVAALAVVSTQREILIGQVDQRLGALPPGAFNELVQVPPPDAQGEIAMVRAPEAAFSDLFIGVVNADGSSAVPLLEGEVPGGIPDILMAVQAAEGRPGIVTIESGDSDTRFRALVMPQPGGGWLVTAQSLAEIDAALSRLNRTLWIAGAVLVGVLGLGWFWVERYGLRPVARVTDIAEAITAGDRSLRVDDADAGTEAGKLGRAFNLMLDERDADETRLRQFVADASHELRTPLTSVQGYLELYRQGAFREAGQLDDVVRRLSAESSRMHGLVEDLLALASLDEHRPLAREAVDIGQILRETVQDARVNQPERAIALEVPGSGPNVTGDRNLLIQLVGILVANALAHTPVTAPIAVSASVRADTVTMTVSDQGPGLDAGSAEHVFDRFWRGEAARTRGSGSTGLGLAIARSIAEAHGGAIDLVTAPGKGCTFTVHLPRP